MHAIAHRGCTDTVRESALEVDSIIFKTSLFYRLSLICSLASEDIKQKDRIVVSGRKIPCRTRDSNPRQYCARLFS